MNRRNFVGSLLTAAAGFVILPPATTYSRVWKAEKPILITGVDDLRRIWNEHYATTYVPAPGELVFPATNSSHSLMGPLTLPHVVLYRGKYWTDYRWSSDNFSGLSLLEKFSHRLSDGQRISNGIPDIIRQELRRYAALDRSQSPVGIAEPERFRLDKDVKAIRDTSIAEQLIKKWNIAIETPKGFE